MLKKIITAFLMLWSAVLFAKPLNLVAAENFYGDIAKSLGGPYVNVVSVLSNPNQDPHSFSSNPGTARDVAAADMVIYNGIDYDPWMVNLLAPTAQQQKKIIVVADLLGKKSGDNPHIWYDPHTMQVYAAALTAALIQLDPAHATYFQQQLADFNKRYAVLISKIAALKTRFQNTPVIATEPVFNEMAKALNLKMYGTGFQLSVMNDAEPSMSDTRDFETMLKQHQVKLLIFNNQVTDPLTDRMKQIATDSGIPILGVTETQPLQEDYFSWISGDLDKLASAL